MPIYAFGSGTLWAVPSTSNPTPVKFGALQDVNVDISSSLKDLFGSYQYAIDAARGTSKINGKAKFAQMSGAAIAQLYLGVTPSSGQTTTANGEAGTIPGVSTYTITVANSATFSSDLGVRYFSTGLPFTRVASSPATGQYSVAAGVYTFAAGDASAPVLLDYKYTVPSTGQLLTVTNPLIGTAPKFSMTLEGVNGSNKHVLTLYACLASKFSLGTKIEDFTIPELDFSAFADASGNVMTWNFSDKG